MLGLFSYFCIYCTFQEITRLRALLDMYRIILCCCSFFKLFIYQNNSVNMHFLYAHTHTLLVYGIQLLYNLMILSFVVTAAKLKWHVQYTHFYPPVVQLNMIWIFYAASEQSFSPFVSVHQFYQLVAKGKVSCHEL